jgi:GH15 family glucan-1,4-alpha-glucosidase
MPSVSVAMSPRVSHPAFEEPEPDPSIEDYAAIGDCRSLALISRFGSVDWWCVPDFSGPSLFGGLLDRERGGRCALTPRRIVSAEQAYEPHTNVLRTRFECADGLLEISDFMTVPEAGAARALDPAPQEIIRICRCVAGTVELQALVEPRPDYGGAPPGIVQQGPGQWTCGTADCAAEFFSTLPLQPAGDGALFCVAPMHAGEQHVAIVHAPPGSGVRESSMVDDANDRLAATVAWWRAWTSRFAYRGPYADAVERSALALKLLTHRPTGAVVAAGTTSLPEGDQGGRNWDYRFCWLRDASLVLHAFTSIGYTAESDAFLRWLLHATKRTRPRLQMLYDVHGEACLPERVIPWLRGYHGIGPVRIGNAASTQQQHDVYGEVISAAWDFVARGGHLDEQEQQLVAGFADVICDLWREPDNGLWEIRLPPRHNTHSKLLCWAGLDRALQMHRRHGLPLDAKRIAGERDALRADIDAHGFNAKVDSYVGFYGSDAADASLLLIPRVGYLPASHPRMQGTVRHIFQQLSVNGLLYRYPPGGAYDGLSGPEHLFAICSFWCVDCLARQGRLDDAHAMFERLLKLRNRAGLYAEEFRVEDGRPMGNFPQAFSHVGLITAALSLSAAAGHRPPEPGA